MARKRICPPEFLGERAYVSKAPYYSKGRTYEPGERITLVDQAPSELMTSLDAPAPKAPSEQKPAVTPQPSGRPSDKKV